jgi:hypothetical protein
MPVRSPCVLSNVDVFCTFSRSKGLRAQVETPKCCFDNVFPVLSRRATTEPALGQGSCTIACGMWSRHAFRWIGHGHTPLSAVTKANVASGILIGSSRSRDFHRASTLHFIGVPPTSTRFAWPEPHRVHGDHIPLAGSGAFGLSRNSTVVKTNSVWPVFSRSWIMNSPGP